MFNSVVLTHEQEMGDQSYAVAWSKSEEILSNTSSGGVFQVLARYIISQGGWVFGTEFSRDTLAQINGYNDENITRFSGSKYVKSKPGNSFIKMKELLEAGKMVLFGGTPCQCAALRKYLAKEYDHLYLVDIICHGSPKPDVFEAYLRYVEKKYDSSVEEIKFRNKDKGWKNGQIEIRFANGKVIKEFFHPKKNKYANVFYSNIALTPGCGECKFNNMERAGDITLGDFWGYKTYGNVEINENGTSVLLLNSPKGMELIHKCADHLQITYVEKEVAMSNNPPLYEHTPINPLSGFFYKAMKRFGFQFAYILCLQILKVLILPYRALEKIYKMLRKM